MGRLSSMVVWGPCHHSCLVVLGPLRCLWLVVWGPLCRVWCWALVVVCGWCCWVLMVFCGWRCWAFTAIHGWWCWPLIRHSGGWALVIFCGWRCRHSRVRVVGHHSCVWVLVVIHQHWFSVLFICHHCLLFIVCPSSPVVCCPSFHVGVIQCCFVS